MTDPFPRIGSRVEAEPASIETPNLPPIPEFTASDVSGTGGNPAHTISFTDQSTDTDGVIVSRVWDYGDAAAPTRPTAKFTFTTSELTATFTDKSTAPTGASINVRDWDFGDGSAHSSAQNPSHTYSTGGSYSAKLTVTDSNATVSLPVQHTVTVASATGGGGGGGTTRGLVRLAPMPVGLAPTRSRIPSRLT
jgi:PKD repeat protein